MICTANIERMENVKAERGYEGPAVVCAVYFTPISGYVPDRPAIKYLVDVARRRSLAGADRRHPRAGAVPLLDADAARHGLVAGDPIRLGRAAVAPVPRRRRNDRLPVRGRPSCGGCCVPVIHRMMSLDSAVEFVIVASVNGFGFGATPRKRGFHPIWYSIADRRAIYRSERIEQAASRRFGRDSFQTRSTR